MKNDIPKTAGDHLIRNLDILWRRTCLSLVLAAAISFCLVISLLVFLHRLVNKSIRSARWTIAIIRRWITDKKLEVIAEMSLLFFIGCQVFGILGLVSLHRAQSFAALGPILLLAIFYPIFSGITLLTAITGLIGKHKKKIHAAVSMIGSIAIPLGFTTVIFIADCMRGLYPY